MASEPSPFIENLISSRNRDISLFLPFLLGLNGAVAEDSGSPPDRIVLINPFTQGMVVIERSSSDNSSSSSSGFDSLLEELFSRKSGRPPASKAAIEAMESVEVVDGEEEGGDDQCVICLEEWEAGERAKRMPCKHRFHGECIEKWLKIHGSCPRRNGETESENDGNSSDSS
ncbi:RING-type E3 ubiquitin transferase [Salvia divinorum]|uniref:RING-type E3 ubiquitin transferase n=1 Tax=Salvia divinorum TaxID=28513 RepID=A0ABD1H3P4_SALDI